MNIDSHQHFWKYSPTKDSWIDETMHIIKRDFMPADLQPVLKNNNIDACIAVQASQSEEETSFLLHLAQKNDFIKAVVGWIDIQNDNILDRLDFFQHQKLLKGLRHIIQSEQPGFMLQKSFLQGLASLKKYGLVYDILIFAKQLEEATELVKKNPNQIFVLDHIAKPNIKNGEIEKWSKAIIPLAKYENVYCKISGMVTETNWKQWQEKDFYPYLDIIFKYFGVERVMYGSDWPVCLLGGTYEQIIHILKGYTQNFSDSEKNKIFGLNAKQVYKI